MNDLPQQLQAALAEVERWKKNFLAFTIAHACQYGEEHHGKDCLHYTHYDLLKEAGARMDDFKRCGAREGTK
jgi:hypothetical protein